MNPTPHLMQQAAASAVVVAGTLALCGTPCALPLAILLSVSALLSIGFGVWYWVRLVRSGVERSDFRRGEDKVVRACVLAGLVVPCVTTWMFFILDAIPNPELHGPSAVVAGVLACAVPITILTSSTVDWYVILPFVRGVFGPPVCQTTEHPEVMLRAYGKYWIMHRWLTELVCYVSVALFVAIAFSAATVSSDGNAVLAPALAAISAGGIVGYAFPRLKSGWEFFFSGKIGLGEHYAGRAGDCSDITGMVVDVSIDGIGLLANPDAKPEVMPLTNCNSADPLPSRPNICAGSKCDRWLTHCERYERAESSNSRGRTDAESDIERPPDLS